jgi:hypothetical protein
MCGTKKVFRTEYSVLVKYLYGVSFLINAWGGSVPLLCAAVTGEVRTAKIGK